MRRQRATGDLLVDQREPAEGLPNGVRWMLRRTTFANLTDPSAASTSGCASSTWYSVWSATGSRGSHTRPSRNRLFRYDGTWSQ
nr:hypothetical protein [Nocardioides sambongensis]